MKRRRDGQGLPEVVCLEGHIDSDLKIIFIVRQRFLEVLVLSDRLPTVFIPLHTQVQIYRRPQLIKQRHSQVDIESQPSIWKGSAWTWILPRIRYLPRHKEQNVDLLHSGKNLEASAATTNATGKQRFSGEILWIFLPSQSVSQSASIGVRQCLEISNPGQYSCGSLCPSFCRPTDWITWCTL